MKLVPRILRTLDRVTGGTFTSTFTEAATTRIPEPDEAAFRSLSTTTRDLPTFKFNRAKDLSIAMWQRNPLAARVIEILVDFCTGNELKVEVCVKKRLPDGDVEDMERDDAQAVWDTFTEDTANAYYQRLKLYAREAFLSGELLQPATVNPVDGAVRLGFIDTKLVTKVVPAPNGLEVDAVTITADGGTEKSYKIVRVDDDFKSPTSGLRTGEALYFRFNHMLGQSRGNGELVPLLDWLDGLDQFLFNTLQGAALRNSFFYWLKMTGMTQKQIDALQIATPKSATVKVTNEKAEWQVITPDLKASDSSEAVRLFKNFIIGSKGFPEHWFADGSNTSMATSENMNAPVMRMIRTKQEDIKNMIRETALFVLDSAVAAKSLSKAPDEFFEIQVSMFDVERKDAAVVAAGFVQAVQALAVAVEKGWTSDEMAKRVVDGNLQRLGIEVDEDETVEENLADKNEKEAVEPYDEDGAPDISQFMQPSNQPSTN